MSENTPDTDFTPPELEEVGRLLPAYEMHYFIAKGGMGAVYMARQKSLDRDVAIKILPRHFGEDASFRASFETEAKSMAKLNHPNLVGIYDFGQVDGLLYIIMEMIHGKSLYHSAYGNTIDPAEAARIVIGICKGLANAHKHGILHRDIKPANILLAPDASPKIGDFGLAKSAGDTDSEVSFGTPGYAAPEVIHNPAAVDQSTDLYSVGVILYELLTGHLPSSTYSPAASEVKCDPEYDRIIRKAIHPSRALRYRSADSMAADLEKLLKGKTQDNPVLMTAGSKPTSETARSLLTATPVANKPKLRSNEPSGRSQPTPVSPPAVSPVGSNIPFIRNIIIIIGLLAAIFIAWEGLKAVRASREAKQELVKQDKAKQEQEAKEKKERQIREKKEAWEARQSKQKKKNVGITPDSLKPVAETPMETLRRLKSALYQGKRNEMPKNTLQSGGRARFFIPTPMTWDEALHFCERHGGHLPVFSEPEELQAFTKHIKSDDGIWLGGGTGGDNQWRWIDGTPWKQKIRNTSKSAYVSVDDTGILKPASQRTRLPFFIEWMMDGSSPGSLESQLKRCAESIQSGKPEYPAGTTSYDSRYYLHVERSGDWQTARDFASAGGGTLSVPSNPDEGFWIASFLERILEGDDACWLGGIHPADKSWQWVTGEPWQFARWNEGAPNGDTSEQLACAATATGKWDDYESSTILGSLLIEWSKDGKGLKKVQTERSAPTDPVAAIRVKCATIIRGIQTRYEKQFKNNISAYEQDIGVFRRSLPKSLKEAYEPGILIMQSRYKGGRIPEDIPRTNMPAPLAKILDSRLEKQSRIQGKYNDEVEDIRKKYRASLTNMSKDFKSKGLVSKDKKVQDELSETHAGLGVFINHILGE